MVNRLQKQLDEIRNPHNPSSSLSYHISICVDSCRGEGRRRSITQLSASSLNETHSSSSVSPGVLEFLHAELNAAKSRISELEDYSASIGQLYTQLRAVALDLHIKSQSSVEQFEKAFPPNYPKHNRTQSEPCSPLIGIPSHSNSTGNNALRSPSIRTDFSFPDTSRTSRSLGRTPLH